MAQKIWITTFGHSCSEADRIAYFASAYGLEGKLIRDLADPVHRYRIARAGGRIVGYAKLGPTWVDVAVPGDLQLSQLYVADDWHGKGIAQALMDWALAMARADGATALLLTVWEHNPRAQRFYQRNGFDHIADHALAVGSQIDRDLILRRVL
jgi:ribosomal protein S18 acetylase RimI-like enzyme